MDMEHRTPVAPHHNDVPPAADPSSGGASAVTPSHPSYVEMITEAIQWGNSQGKERGSSKKAIDKYIERVYTNLPLGHSALLTHHLNRLKNSGKLVVAKNSYDFSSAFSTRSRDLSAPVGSTSAKRGRGRPPKQKFNVDPDTAFDHGSGSGSERKRPGRPRKLYREGAVATEVSFVQQSAKVNGEASSVGQKRRGRPPKLQAPQELAVILFDPKETSETPKRRPGRPRKHASSVGEGEFKRRSSEGSVRPRGRPRSVLGSAASSRAVGKRPVGRPRKIGREFKRRSSEGSVRPRGRPRRVLGPAASSRAVGKRPVGRPRKIGGTASVGALGIGIGMGMRRGRGRLPKGGRPRKLVGRPRKDASILRSHTADKEVAYEELLRKSELIQSKIREALIVIRPYVADENPGLMALEQLEELATIDLTASPNVPPETMTIPQSTSGDSPARVVPVSIAPPSTASPTANISTRLTGTVKVSTISLRANQ